MLVLVVRDNSTRFCTQSRDSDGLAHFALRDRGFRHKHLAAQHGTAYASLIRPRTAHYVSRTCTLWLGVSALRTSQSLGGLLDSSPTAGSGFGRARWKQVQE